MWRRPRRASPWLARSPRPRRPRPRGRRKTRTRSPYGGRWSRRAPRRGIGALVNQRVEVAGPLAEIRLLLEAAHPHREQEIRPDNQRTEQIARDVGAAHAAALVFAEVRADAVHLGV